MSSTDEGMQIEDRFEHREKADDSIRFSFEGLSKVTTESAPHSEKEWRQSTSTDEGMQTDESARQSSKALSSIR